MDSYQSPSENSNLNAISLVEHSYCAVAGNSLENVTDCENIRDPIFYELQAPTQQGGECGEHLTGINLPHHVELTPLTDVNFDGFNFSIPPSTDSMELGTMWEDLGGLNSNINTVEVAATVSISEPNEVQNEENGGIIGESEGDEGKRRRGRGRQPKYSRPRRRDFINDEKTRRGFFEQRFQQITSQFHRAMSRTGCDGELVAYFEGKVFTTVRGQNSGLSSFPTLESNSNVRSADVLRQNGHAEVDDHRYAATMLTQKLSSPTVKDHQYNEKTVVPTQDSELDGETEDSFGFSGTKKRKRTERHDYIKVRWTRDQTFSKFAKSIFVQKSVLENRTGASVNLTLTYGRCTINEDNYQSAYEIILCSRKPLKVTPAKIAPKPVQSPLTFIVPKFAPMTIPIQCLIPTTTSPEMTMQNGRDLAHLGNVDIDDLQVQHLALPISSGLYNYNCEETEMNVDQSISSVSINEHIKEQNSIKPNHLQRYSEGNSGDMTLAVEIGSVYSANSSLQNSPRQLERADVALVADRFESNQRSPEPNISAARELTDSSTNTEPMCTLCQNTSNNSTNRQSAYWIRCNDPFCYNMVHASCMGFLVNCSSHLRQLPAYYCKSHR